MADFPFKTDRKTRRRLRGIRAGIGEQLRPVDCQTCGQPLRPQPALVVYIIERNLAEATLHHQTCHQPGWYEGAVEPFAGRPHLTWRAGTFALPAAAALGASDVDVPVFLVNPSYESALLRSGADGWRLGTIARYTELGLSRGPTPSLTEPNPILSATVNDGRVSVTMRAPGDIPRDWSNIPMSADVADLVRSRGSIVVAVTTVVDVHQPLAPMRAALLVVGGFASAVGVAAVR